MLQRSLPLRCGTLKNLETRSIPVAKQTMTRAVKKIVTAVLNKSLTVPQQVLALCIAMKHKSMRIYSTSAGLLASPNNLDNYIVSNIRDTIQLARKTDTTKGKSE